jgi:hypothetical protein
LEMTKVAPNSGPCTFHAVKLCINFDKKKIGLHFELFFRKLIWSPWRQTSGLYQEKNCNHNYDFRLKIHSLIWTQKNNSDIGFQTTAKIVGDSDRTSTKLLIITSNPACISILSFYFMYIPTYIPTYLCFWRLFNVFVQIFYNFAIIFFYLYTAKVNINFGNRFKNTYLCICICPYPHKALKYFI